MCRRDGLGRAYAVNTNYGPTPPTANPSQLGHLRQQIGTVDRRSDVVLTFDVSAPWKPDGLLNVSILDDQLNPLAGGNFPAGPNQQLTAKAVPAGTALTILFQALQSTPGLDNVTVTARPAKRSRAARVKTTKAPVTVAAYYYPCTHPHPRWDSAKYRASRNGIWSGRPGPVFLAINNRKFRSGVMAMNPAPR